MRIVSLFVMCLIFETTVAFSFSPALPSLPKKSLRRTRASRFRLDMSVPSLSDTVTSGLASICRLPHGVTVTSELKRLEKPPRLVVLYDVEASIACRAVRERITELDLVVEKIVPSAKNSRTFVDKDYEHFLPAESEIPRLVVVEESGDQRAVVGSEKIVSYLNACFVYPADLDDDDNKKVKKTVVRALTTVGGYVAVALRLGKGSAVASAAAVDKKSVPRPKKPLILYSYEGNQFCRLVREVMTELDLVYELRSTGKESPRRKELAATTGGSTQCPFLIDPNTDTKMQESADIIRYLYKTYALWTPPDELLQAVSNTVLPLFRPVFSALAPLQAGSMEEDKSSYEADIARAKALISREIAQAPVVVYTYKLSPFSSETKALLENLEVEYAEISLGLEWVPFLIEKGGSAKRAALLEMTGQSSLPHVFIGGDSIGGLFSGTPGLVPALEKGTLKGMITKAVSGKRKAPAAESDQAEQLGEFE